MESSEIREPLQVMARMYEEVGFEHRETLHRVIEEHLNEDWMYNTSVEEGIRRVVELTKARLPKAPQPKTSAALYDGKVLEAPEEERGPGLAGVIRRRRERLHAGRFAE
jgi:hypothetical protein